MFDEALRSAEACRTREQTKFGGDGEGAVSPAGYHQRDQSAETPHLSLRQLVTWIGVQAGIVHAIDPWMSGQERRYCRGTGAVALHSYRERSDPATYQPAVERRWHSAAVYLE